MDVECFDGEREVAEAICQLGSELADMLTVIRFLAREDVRKNNSTRMIAYMVGLKVLSDERQNWIPGIMKLGAQYESSCDRFFSDCYDRPCDSLLKKAKAAEIRRSVADSWEWFVAVCCNQKIPPEHVSDGKVRVERMFAQMLREGSGFDYCSSYTRIGYMAYIVCLSFSLQGGLSHFFAEAMACAIARALISVCARSKRMIELKLMDEYFEKLDKLTERFAGTIRKQAHATGVDIYELAVRWELSMFTDVHCPENVLLLWDHLIFHVEEYHFFLRFLFVAHFIAMEKAGISLRSKSARDEMPWNGVALLESTNELMNRDLVPPFTWWSFCPCYSIISHMIRYAKGDTDRLKAKKLF